LSSPECCCTAGPGEKASDEQHEEAREKLNSTEKPADITAPSSIRQYTITVLVLCKLKIDYIATYFFYHFNMPLILAKF